MSDHPISLKNFKLWLSDQKDLSDFFNIDKDQEDPNEQFIGKMVRSKVSEGKLLEKIETEDDVEVVVQEFLDNGGTILGIDGKKVQVEVESGSFYLPRFCLKIRKDKAE